MHAAAGRTRIASALGANHTSSCTFFRRVSRAHPQSHLPPPRPLLPPSYLWHKEEQRTQKEREEKKVKNVNRTGSKPLEAIEGRFISLLAPEKRGIFVNSWAVFRFQHVTFHDPRFLRAPSPKNARRTLATWSLRVI